MIKSRNTVFFFALLFNTVFLWAWVPPDGINSRGLRFSFGPTLGFYKINTNHAQNPSAKMSILAGLKKEVRVDQTFQTFFLFGADYFLHGINFRSYYFDQDTLRLYNEKFEYDYSVLMHELQVPLQLKFSFTRENNSLYSPYVMIGYHLRALLPAKVTVSQDGNRVVSQNEEMRFKMPMLTNKLNSLISATVGWQKNTINNSKTGFFIELNYRYGFSQYYFASKYTPSSLYMNSQHMSLLLGLKF
jgi:hypothetical protein